MSPSLGHALLIRIAGVRGVRVRVLTESEAKSLIETILRWSGHHQNHTGRLFHQSLAIPEGSPILLTLIG